MSQEIAPTTPSAPAVDRAAACSPRFHGKQCPKAILRGETEVSPGDTFIQESEDGMGFAAMRYTPKEAMPPRLAWKNFTLLARGTWETCHAAANQK